MEGWVMRSSLDSANTPPVARIRFPLVEHWSLEFVPQCRLGASRKRFFKVTFVIGSTHTKSGARPEAANHWVERDLFSAAVTRLDQNAEKLQPRRFVTTRAEAPLS